MTDLLVAKQLSKTYAQGQSRIAVLDNLNLSVSKHSTVAILGQSGSGKSTLLSLLCGLDHPDSGEVHIDGHILTNMNETSLAAFRGHMIGIVFQQFHLIKHLTALENVMLPLRLQGHKSPLDPAKQALRDVGLEHRWHHFPGQLSGGECQRVAIARAFVVSPSILIADEPSGNLDVETGQKVMDHLFDLITTRQMTMVLVTHNQSLAARCQNVYTLNRGQLEKTWNPPAA